MSEFRKPDLTAPRFRGKTKTLLNKKLHVEFIKKYPQHKNLGLREFKTIVSTYNGELWKATMKHRDGVELPESLGYLLVAKCDKPKKENIDYLTSAKYGKRVTFRNWDSDNYLAKICYSNYSLKYRFADRELWRFEATKSFKSSVAHSFAENYNKYLYLTEDIRLSKLYKNI